MPEVGLGWGLDVNWEVGGQKSWCFHSVSLSSEYTDVLVSVVLSYSWDLTSEEERPPS